MKTKYLFIIISILGFTSCDVESGINDSGNNDNSIIGGVEEVVSVTSNLTVSLSTDKAFYAPGETVIFNADNVPQGAMIRYRADGLTVEEQKASSTSWTWTVPQKDFQDYLVEIYTVKDNLSEIIHGTIAVDASSDWKRYPRYGFVADFGSDKLTPGVIEDEMDFLNRCHINGIQFYDWHNKHHWPLGGTRNHLEMVYKDIANRDVYTEAIQKYIDVQHKFGMKSIFYNLCYGALDDGAEDGVKKEWSLYKRPEGADQDAHNLPPSWKSSIYLLDPSNSEWQDYLAERNDEVYSNFNFDGFHVDQLGDRGKRYNAKGQEINLPSAFSSFLVSMKKRHPDKCLIMNAVGGYAAKDIAECDKTDFMYNEVWANQGEFRDLYNIIKANDLYSKDKKNTVFAAYMNYECSNRDFNLPGVLLTDAVIFALGGSHIELGDHMLCREYFPNRDVKMSESLKAQIIRYYDFMTAYQNLLRGESSTAEIAPGISVVKGTGARAEIRDWPPQKGKIITYAKEIDGKKIVHLLNFLSADQTSWRDLKGTMPTPRLVRNLQVKVKIDREVSRIWLASPDRHAGAAQDLAFQQKEGHIWFTLPSLNYWDMVVIE